MFDVLDYTIDQLNYRRFFEGRFCSTFFEFLYEIIDFGKRATSEAYRNEFIARNETFFRSRVIPLKGKCDAAVGNI